MSGPGQGRLAGKVAVITGAARGIGRAAAAALAEAGADVAGIDIAGQVSQVLDFSAGEPGRSLGDGAFGVRTRRPVALLCAGPT